jgi:hypothetical protein
MARFIVYSWPHYPLCSALAEASAMLQSPKAQDGAEAQHVQQYMTWRRNGMRAECDWLVSQAETLTNGGLCVPGMAGV